MNNVQIKMNLEEADCVARGGWNESETTLNTFTRDYESIMYGLKIL
jgi:hypothetical protein